MKWKIWLRIMKIKYKFHSKFKEKNQIYKIITVNLKNKFKTSLPSFNRLLKMYRENYKI